MKIPDIPSQRKVTILAFGFIITIFAFVWLASSSQTNAQSDDARQPLAANAATGTGFTYQGQLNQSSMPANGSFSFQFALYDSATGGTQIGATQAKTVVVSNGLFTVLLNDAGEFGPSAFNGEVRYLEIIVNGTTLTPRQSLTAAPYAQSLLPGAVISGIVTDGTSLNMASGALMSLVAYGSSGGSGLNVESAGMGVQVYSAETGLKVGTATNFGILVDSAAVGFQVNSATLNGVAVNSASVGLNVANATNGVYVANATAHGLVVGSAANGVYVVSASEDGVHIASAVDDGVEVTSASTGVYVESVTGSGVVVGAASTGVFVAGPATNWAGYFTGDVNVTGTCTGCLIATFGVNTGDSPLQPGDVVALQGIRSGESIGQPLLMEVSLARAGTAVVGVVYGHGEMIEVEGRDGQMITQLVPREGTAQPGDYVHIVIYGPMQVRASALGSAIQLGDKLSVNDSGAVRSLQTRLLDGMSITESAPTIGIALESLEADTDGLIWVLVNPQ